MNVSEMTFDDLAKIISDFFCYNNNGKRIKDIVLILDEIPNHLVYGNPGFSSEPSEAKQIDRTEIRIGNRLYHSIGLYKRFEDVATVQALDKKAFEWMINDFTNSFKNEDNI